MSEIAYIYHDTDDGGLFLYLHKEVPVADNCELVGAVEFKPSKSTVFVGEVDKISVGDNVRINNVDGWCEILEIIEEE